MEIGIIKNKQTGQILGTSVGKANSFWTRFRGLMHKKQLVYGEGLWILPCSQIHMFGMKIPLSVWFITKEGVICHIIDHINPGKISPKIKEAFSVIEFPSGWAQQVGAKVGDIVSWEEIN